MDELSRVIRDLMNSLPASGPEDAASSASSAMPDVESSIPPQSESSEESEEQNAVEAGNFGAGLEPLLSGLGGSDLSGILGSIGGSIPEQNPRIQLLLALKPHLSEHRCSCIDRLCRLLSTAYGIRSALQLLGKV